jgi:hypothetical protein
VRPQALKLLFSGALALLGYFRFAALQFKDRGHQIGLIATLKRV